MKNFKKVLALVLVVVMALGLMTVTSAAFTDAESITKNEAVTVLDAIGVIGGFPDGSFKPEGDVTRAEMAKMVSVILNKGEDVNDLYKNACAFPDAANHWAAGYIAYCAQEGVLQGRNATTFDPDGKVTGTEAAKMLLGALGYDATTEGFIGATWSSAVLSKAASAGLVGKDYNLTVSMGEPLNRDNAAQMMLNALKATTVEYENTSTVTIGDVVINNNSKAKEVYSASNDADNIVRGTQVDGKYTYELGEKMFPDLLLDDGTADDFARVGNNWVFEGTDLGTFAAAADKIYKDRVVAGTLYTDLGKPKMAEYDVTYFIDGVENADAEDEVITHLKSGDKNDIGETGSTLEIYQDTTEKELTFVQINYYVGKIAQVTAEKKDANGDISQNAYVRISSFSNNAHNAAEVAELDNGTASGNATIQADGYTAADKDAIVVYTYSASENRIESITKAASVTGIQKGTTTEGGVKTEVTVDSTTYKLAAAHATETPDDYGEVGGDITVYTDPNGNVIYIEAVSSNDFALVRAAGESGEFAGDGEYKARLVFADGTVKVVPTTQDYTAQVGKIASYTVQTDGKYKLTEQDTEVAANYLYTTGTVAIQNGMKADDTTTFVVETIDADDVATITVYTGIKNVPSIAGDGADLYAFAKTDENAKVVYLLDVAEGDIDTGVSATNVVALFATTSDQLRSTANGGYYTVKAVVNGAVSSVKIDKDKYQAAWQGHVTLMKSGKTNADGIYTSVTVENDNKYFLAGVSFDKDGGTNTYTGTYDKGIISIDGTAISVTESLPLFAFDTVDSSLTASTAGAFYPADTMVQTVVLYDRDKVNADANDKVPAAIYVIQTSN